jgi:CO/xanthine dehydrogenase Mo-binding subunit
MRQEETAWDTKGPAYAIKMRGGLDRDGNLVALDYEARACDHNHLGYNEPDTVLIAQLAGMRRSTPARGGVSMPSDMYAVPNRRMAGHVVGLPVVWETPVRTGNLRDPNGPQVTFASESFIDELAAAAKVDPVAFRLKLLTASADDDSGFRRARSIAVVKAAAEKYGWDARPSPRPRREDNVLTGRGIAYAPRNGSIVAVVAEVAVERASGRYRVTRFTVAHDCGFVVNPKSLEGTIEANLIQSMSRAMHEQVSFDATRVLSVDWATYPIVDITEIPDAIDIVMLNNRPDAPSRGAGEPSSRPTVAAIGNALYDATGVLVMDLPLTPERVLRAIREMEGRPLGND